MRARRGGYYKLRSKKPYARTKFSNEVLDPGYLEDILIRIILIIGTIITIIFFKR